MSKTFVKLRASGIFRHAIFCFLQNYRLGKTPYTVCPNSMHHIRRAVALDGDMLIGGRRQASEQLFHLDTQTKNLGIRSRHTLKLHPDR